jgi:hypothetical protein
MNNDATQPGITPTKSVFTPRTFEVDAPSGRKYVLRELTGYEQRQSDGGLENQSDVIVYRIIMSIGSVDGETLLPRASRAFQDLLLKSISGPDLDALTIAYVRAFAPQAQAAEIKNESAPSD